MNVTDLQGQAKEHYDYWRHTVGLSEADALRRVEESGAHLEDQLTEIFMECGMSESGARFAARGRDGGARPAHPFDEAVARYERMGMSPEAAKVAAAGRGLTESQARTLYAETARPDSQQPAARPMLESSRQPVRVPLQEKARAVPSLPEIVARADSLRLQGLSEAAAARAAYREIYGQNPNGGK